MQRSIALDRNINLTKYSEKMVISGGYLKRLIEKRRITCF
jgi:hypothetical protein